jgi:hypothetical protein
VDGASETEKGESEQMTGVVLSEAVAGFGELGGRTGLGNLKDILQNCYLA